MAGVDPDLSDPRDQLAHELQTKFEFYTVALTFTILGLSIQTARFGANVVADGLELLGWLALLTSALVGLRRLDRTPELFRLFSLLDHYDTRARGARELRASGHNTVLSLEDEEEHPMGEVIANAEAWVHKLDPAIRKERAAQIGRSRWQRATLFGGICLLVIARAYVPAGRVLAAALRAIK